MVRSNFPSVRRIAQQRAGKIRGLLSEATKTPEKEIKLGSRLSDLLGEDLEVIKFELTVQRIFPPQLYGGSYNGYMPILGNVMDLVMYSLFPDQIKSRKDPLSRQPDYRDN